jgi:hypothetical protein
MGKFARILFFRRLLLVQDVCRDSRVDSPVLWSGRGSCNGCYFRRIGAVDVAKKTFGHKNSYNLLQALSGSTSNDCR